jgi:hypothetical protein
MLIDMRYLKGNEEEGCIPRWSMGTRKSFLNLKNKKPQ